MNPMNPMKPMKHLITMAALAVAPAFAPAFAHVTLEWPQVTAGETAKLVFRVGHGCQGSATHTLSVSVPPGFRGAKPMPKPGWAITLRRAPLAEPYDSHGRRVTEDVVEVTWRATTREAWLEDAHYDEFVLRGQAPAHPGPTWFTVRQTCERGEWLWADRPAEGQSTRGLKAPAVLLDVQPASGAAGHAH